MDLSAIAIQQASAQMNASLSFVKQNAQSDQAFVNMLMQNSPSAASGRGQNLDISI